jgi:hypothetical protein
VHSFAPRTNLFPALLTQDEIIKLEKAGRKGAESYRAWEAASKSCDIETQEPRVPLLHASKERQALDDDDLEAGLTADPKPNKMRVLYGLGLVLGALTFKAVFNRF